MRSQFHSCRRCQIVAIVSLAFSRAYKKFLFFLPFERGDHVESRRLSRDTGNVISPRVSGEWKGGGVVLRLHIASICTGEKLEATLTKYRSNFHTNCTKI